MLNILNLKYVVYFCIIIRKTIKEHKIYKHLPCNIASWSKISVGTFAIKQ